MWAEAESTDDDPDKAHPPTRTLFYGLFPRIEDDAEPEDAGWDAREAVWGRSGVGEIVWPNRLD